MKKYLLGIFSLLLSLTLLSACSSNTPTEPNSWYHKGDIKSTVGTASDYSLSTNWLNVPTSNYNTDVIYLYPSCYFSSSAIDPRVCDITDESMRSNAANSLSDQASVFETVGNIYVPYYRQYDMARISSDNRDDLYSYLSNEPRTDVFAALNYYFENYNNNKPYILAGHSQGSVLLNMVLAEYMSAHPEYYERMVAAYQIGYSVSQQWLDANPHIKLASSEKDTGVVISWCTEAPSNLGRVNLFVLDNSLSINPLNWSTDDKHVSKSNNKGSRIKTSSGEYEIIPNLADAKINYSRGTVICTSVDPNVYSSARTDTFGDGSFADYDYAFYYMNIRENAQTRINEYIQSR